MTNDMAAQPRQKVFDPWNSSSTGHQRAEMRQASGWSAIRQIKTNSQFKDGGRGGIRLVHPTDQDDKRPAEKSVMDMLRRPGSMSTVSASTSSSASTSASATAECNSAQSTPASRKLFDGVTVNINGSTYPLISDHKLKMLLAENGATMSLGLARRKVTHVILGKGLAGGKLDKEVKRVRGCGVHYVGAEWVLDSLKAGKRLPESRFSKVNIGGSGQVSVLKK